MDPKDDKLSKPNINIIDSIDFKPINEEILKIQINHFNNVHSSKIKFHLIDKLSLNNKFDDKIILQNIKNLSQNSNINTSIRPLDITRERPNVFVLDSATGTVTNSNNPRDMAIGFYEFITRYQQGTYFPILVDIAKPQQLTFGIGVDAKDLNGLPVDRTLIRNGGHIQLLEARTGQTNGGSDGIYGGGVFLNSEGQIQIEFKSRGLNSRQGANSEGQLSDEQESILRQLVQQILLSAEEVAEVRRSNLQLAGASF